MQHLVINTVVPAYLCIVDHGLEAALKVPEVGPHVRRLLPALQHQPVPAATQNTDFNTIISGQFHNIMIIIVSDLCYQACF